MNNLIEIGYIAKAHGIRGEVCIVYHADSLALLKQNIVIGKTVQNTRSMQIKTYRQNKEQIIVAFEGISNRNDAENLRGNVLFIAKEHLAPLNENEVYRYMLFGCIVQDKNLEYVGILENIQDIAGQEIWYIKNSEGKEILFPAVETFIVSVDAEKKNIIIDPPIGLLDVYLSE